MPFSPRPSLSRRSLLAGLGGIALPFALPFVLPIAAHAAELDALELGLVPGSVEDQSSALQEAVLRAAREGRPLFLPGGEYRVDNVTLPGGLELRGVWGATVIVAAGAAPALRISGSSNVTLGGLTLAGSGIAMNADAGLLDIEGSGSILLSQCRFIDSTAHGVVLHGSSAAIDKCDFNGHRDAGIFSMDGTGITVTGSIVGDCGNGGILIWGSGEGHRDRSIITGNRIAAIGARSGGNGQNGNGVNVFKASEVIIADNHIGDCAFSAVRVNSGRNTQIRGNTCMNSGEVAIFCEFAFSGAVVANNIVDGAATGISITNLDHGGHLAVCTGNIVRNIAPRSEVNPDTRPIGIYVEAETVVSGNTVEGVPGIAIAAGYGPFVRNVVISGNVIAASDTGIGVSVVDEPGAGSVLIADNMIGALTTQAIVGLEWDRIVSDDLARDAGRFPRVSVTGNTITR